METTIKSQRVRIFESSLEKLARILSSKWKIIVRFKADDCKTSGNIIYLPAIPNNASQDLLEALQGYLDHEAAHVVFTDFECVKKLSRKDKKLFTLTNAMEDPRIEKKMIDLWRGTSVNLKRALEWALNKHTVTKEMDDINNPGQKIQQRTWDLLTDFGKVCIGLAIFGSTGFKKDHWFLNDVVEPDIRAKVFQCEDWLRKAVSAEKTDEVIDCAKEVMKILNEEEEKDNVIDPKDIPDNATILPPGAGPSPQQETMMKRPKPDPNAPPVIQLEHGDSGDDDGELSAQGDEEEDNIGSVPPLDTFDPNQEVQKGGGKGRYEVTDEDLERDSKIASMPELLKQAVHKEFTGQDKYLIYTTEGDKVERVKNGDRMQYKEFMTEANSMVSVLKRRMSRSLLATNVSRWEGDKFRGKLNPRALFRVSIGTSKRVFRQKVEAEDFDTAIQIMIDHSESMSGYKIDLAAKTAIVLGEVANQLHIPFSVVGFSTGESSISRSRYNHASLDEKRMYVRWGNHAIDMYKDFDEMWMHNNHKLINMVDKVRQNTYDGESLKYAAQRLINRKEKRKILFWLNDGQPCPNDADDCRAHEEYAKLCAQEVEKCVELVAVGICTDAVKSFYTNFIVVNEVKELPAVCLTQLSDLLRKGKRLTTRVKAA